MVYSLFILKTVIADAFHRNRSLKLFNARN